MIIRSRQQLNTAQYDACVHQASNCRVYAYSWYLDAFCDDWYAIVLGDYEAVMPVPIRRKWGLSYVYKPPFIQQLGVFGPPDVTTSEFYKRLRARHLHIDYHHSGPPAKQDDVERQNLIVSIRPESFASTLNSNRRRDMKKAERAKLTFHGNVSWQEAGHYFSSHQLTDRPLPAQAFHQLYHADKNVGQFELAVVKEGDNVIFLQAYAMDRHRVYNLIPMAIDPRARETGAATFALTKLVEHVPEQITTLDFEGSSIPSIEKFYRSMGGEKESYYQYRRSIF